MNRLSKEKSAYLRHSSNQKIDWYPWSDEAFERAGREDKPVFLSSGGVWCHWCHVMAKECFEDEEIVRLLNEKFINVKIDRDERPDIDWRYQQAVIAMGSSGGWPLSVFLTPDKKPFFGGTYFPPEDRHGMPGLRKVLITVSDFYRLKREDVSEYTERIMDFLKPKPVIQGEINEYYIDEEVKNILSEFDSKHGGFGTSPKFHIPGTMEFLINRYSLTGDEFIGEVIKKTLISMAKGGFHDQIGGGFHRYSTDEAWTIPHFEKMADDNAWLLRNYIDAYSLFRDDYFKKVAEGIIRFIRETLSDPEGGFYGSQDADVTPDDEGGYFTWRDEDLRRVLDSEEYNILSLHLFHEKGYMHHDETKRVLFVSMDEKEIAEKTGKDIKDIIEKINNGKEKLLIEREKREAPFIDRRLYTSINGILISSYLRAFRVLKDRELKDIALKGLERVWDKFFINNELFHTEGIRAILDDYIYLIDAFISAYEVTGDSSYLNRAENLMNICINKFWDNSEGGFFDTDNEVIGIRLKGIEDIPHPSPNSLAIVVLLKLGFITQKEIYNQYAEKSLKTFSLRAKDMGIHSGYYYYALDAYFNMIKLTLETLPGSKLADAALSSLTPYISISYGEDKGRVIPCIKNVCYEPLNSTDSIREFLKKKWS